MTRSNHQVSKPKTSTSTAERPSDPKYGNIVRHPLENREPRADFETNPIYKEYKHCAQHGPNKSHDIEICEARANEKHMLAGLPLEDMPHPKALKYFKSDAQKRIDNYKLEKAKTRRNMNLVRPLAPSFCPTRLTCLSSCSLRSRSTRRTCLTSCSLRSQRGRRNSVAVAVFLPSSF